MVVNGTICNVTSVFNRYIYTRTGDRTVGAAMLVSSIHK